MDAKKILDEFIAMVEDVRELKRAMAVKLAEEGKPLSEISDLLKSQAHLSANGRKSIAKVVHVHSNLVT